MSLYLLLFWEFFKTGLFSIGGGLATIPFLMDMSEKYGWFTSEELSNMIAVSESTPGPIGINMSTYTGFTSLGIGGALVATLGLVLPSLIIIMIIAVFLQKFKENALVKDTFYCIRPAVVGLLGVSLWSMAAPIFFCFTGKTFFDFVDVKSVILFAVLLFGIMKFNKHPILYIGIGAVVGIVFGFLGV